eukprot:6487865-Heterocapsa_arctica.AAC.1
MNIIFNTKEECNTSIGPNHLLHCQNTTEEVYTISTPNIRLQGEKGHSQGRSTNGQSHTDCHNNLVATNIVQSAQFGTADHGTAKRQGHEHCQKEEHHKDNCRVGKASDPGPGEQNKQHTQSKHGDFFHNMHTPKDDKAE